MVAKYKTTIHQEWSTLIHELPRLLSTNYYLLIGGLHCTLMVRSTVAALLMVFLLILHSEIKAGPYDQYVRVIGLHQKRPEYASQLKRFSKWSNDPSC